MSRPRDCAHPCDADELAALAEIEGATSNRLLAQNSGTAAVQAYALVYGVPYAAFINAFFVYEKPREANRFNGTERGAWHAALELQTCLDEVRYHLTKALAQTGVFEAMADYAERHASFAGEFVDLRLHANHVCLHPDKSVSYPTGNALADAARARGLNGIIYPSVRHGSGTCIAALFPHAVRSVAQGYVYRMIWRGAAKPCRRKGGQMMATYLYLSTCTIEPPGGWFQRWKFQNALVRCATHLGPPATRSSSSFPPAPS